MSTSCSPCESYRCTCPIATCINSLVLGNIADVNTDVYIFIQKQNGAEWIQAATSNASGTVILDMTDPSKDFFNQYDGLYKVWVTGGNPYFCDEQKLSITINGLTSYTYGITFFNSATNAIIGDIIEIIPLETSV